MKRTAAPRATAQPVMPTRSLPTALPVYGTIEGVDEAGTVPLLDGVGVEMPVPVVIGTTALLLADSLDDGALYGMGAG